MVTQGIDNRTEGSSIPENVSVSLYSSAIGSSFPLTRQIYGDNLVENLRSKVLVVLRKPS